MAEAKEEAKDGAKGGEGSKLDIAQLGGLVLVVLNLLGMGLGGFLIFKSTLGYERPSIREEDVVKELTKEREDAGEAEPLVYTMDEFTVNLSGSPRRMIRVAMSLEMLDDEGYEEVVTLGPRARDAVVKILNSKEFRDVETIQGKLFLKDQISVTLNEFLKKGVVKDIYFSQFLVQ